MSEPDAEFSWYPMQRGGDSPAVSVRNGEWPGEAVAIVGVGCRLPGGIDSLDGLWEALEHERDLVGEVPADRFDAAQFVSPGGRRQGKAYTGAGGFLSDVASFDADFFGISPKEASRIDPQQRLLLECAVEAFDDAGIDPAQLAGSETAVMMGVASHDFGELQHRRLRAFNAYTAGGMGVCNTANRLSYVFDLRGPSAAVDTACASTLTAVHQACEALRSGRSPLALAGGVGVLLGPGGYVGFSQASMLSPTGRCRPFSAGADGFVRSEGAGVLVLKSLGAAVADGDRVHAVIAASGVNNDGRTAGIALPNPRAQAALLRRVYAAAGVTPEEVGYVEAHGTGTQAGDPIECEALGEALGWRRGAAGAVPVGSVKSNLGHLEAAAGVPGLLKAVLVLRERRIPATLHAEPVSAAIDFNGLGLEPVTAARPLAGSGRQVVGVNSFGLGGANAHVVLAAPPLQAERAASAGLLPVVVTARTAPALEQAALRWAERLEQADAGEFEDLAFTASRRRARHEHRIAVLAASPQEAAGALRALAAGDPAPGAASGRAVQRGRVGFVFSGNGAQWAGMGSELLAADPVFRAEVAAVDKELSASLGWSVLEELGAPVDPGRWELTEVAQPLLFAVQAGLVAALAARGVRPLAVCGHSVGEVAAAYCAGALDRAAACQLIGARSRAQAATAGAGRMAAVGLSAPDTELRLAEAGLAGRLSVAAFNGERDVSVAGDAQALAAFGAALDGDGVFFRDLGLDYAFHTAAMDALREPLKAELAGLEAGSGRLPLVSTVTGAVVEGGALDGEYWWRNVREPVRFAQALSALTGDLGCDVLVEIGPHPVLATYLRRATARLEHPVAVLSTLTRTAAGPQVLDTAQAHLLAAGADLDWDVVFPGPRRVVTAPAYPWQRERHWSGDPSWWLEDAAADADGTDPGARHELLGTRQGCPEPAWRQRIEPDRPAWLADHRVGQAVVVPAAAYVDMALAAGQALFEAPCEVRGLSIERALTLAVDDPEMEVDLHSTMAADGAFTVASRSSAGAQWVTHARGRVRRLLRERPPALDVEAIRARLPHPLTAQEHYAACAQAALPYGPAFRTLTGLRSGEGEVLAQYAATIDIAGAHPAHPTVLDGALQAGLPLLAADGADPVPYLPSAIESVRCWQPLPATGFVHLRSHAGDTHEARWDLTVTGPDGTIALEITGGQMRRFDAARRAEPVRLTEVLRAAPLPGGHNAPAPLPAPADTLATCTGDLQALAQQCHPHPYADIRHRTLEMSAHFTAAALRELLPAQDTFTLTQLFAAGVDPKHAPVLRLLASSACEMGVLRADGPERWSTAAVLDPGRLVQDALRDFPAESVSIVGHAVCGRHLAAVLRGDTDPLELLFSETDAIAARFYDGTPLSHFRNGAARRLLRETVAHWPADRPLRVLEVGAGTGGTTAELLPELDPQRTHYTYTDVSPAFFTQAKARFADHDFLHYRRLDLDADPAEQGFTPGTFDLVIAANVLHATANLPRTLRRVADLLADGGQLLALECHSNEVLAPIFGLLDSFWLATDTDLRPRGPLLARENWSPLLETCGFTATAQTGDNTDPSGGDCSVILTTRAPRTSTSGADLDPPTTQAADGTRRWLIADLREPAPARTHDIVQSLREHVGTEAVRVLPPGVTTANWAELFAEHSGELDIVLLTEDPPGASPQEITERSVRHCAVLRALAGAHQFGAERSDVTVWLVTHGANNRAACAPSAPGAGAVAWGAARSLGNEQPRLAVRRVELTRTGTHEDEARILADRLAQEMLERPEDDEVLLTAAGRFVTRVRTPAPPRPVPGGAEPVPYTLTLNERGLHYRLGWRASTVPVPQRGEALVQVAATALNYRDVMIATGLVPAPETERRTDAVALGMECAGTVTAVGPDVATLVPGDRVVALTVGSFGSHALTRADRLLTIPDDMTFAEAVTMPAVFVTVRHSLHHLARLARDETLLVHGGAGGVGLAALQHARHVGARVIATAGTPAKRDLLHLLGADHVLDSRSLHFADQITELTSGRGVDVVLNSLAGEAMVRSLGVLREGGRFLELGKRDFLADNTLPLAPFARNLSFFGVDVSPMFEQDSSTADTHLAALGEAMRTGVYRPLPHRTYPAARIREAFACLQHSRHIGKVVVTFEEPVPVAPPTPRRTLDPAATYLVTGGLSGFGAATARHLAARGARHLTLIGRRGANTPEAGALLSDLAVQGVEVQAHAADASDSAAMRHVFDSADAAGRRVAGIVHAAMVPDDGLLTELTDERVRAVLAAKLTAGHLLDDLTRRRHLDFFVVHSSMTAVVGQIRQSSYAGANTGLEALIRDRHRAGLSALALQWSVISDAGYVHRTGRGEEMASIGLGPMTAHDALTAFDELLEHPHTDVIAVVGDIDWGKLHTFAPTLSKPRAAALLPAREHAQASDQLRTALAHANPQDATRLVEDALAELLAQVLQTTADRVDRHRRIDQIGVDSLMAAEFTTLVRRHFDCEIPVVEVIGATGITAITQRVLTRLGHTRTPAAV